MLLDVRNVLCVLWPFFSPAGQSFSSAVCADVSSVDGQHIRLSASSGRMQKNSVVLPQRCHLLPDRKFRSSASREHIDNFRVRFVAVSPRFLGSDCSHRRCKNLFYSLCFCVTLSHTMTLTTRFLQNAKIRGTLCILSMTDMTIRRHTRALSCSWIRRHRQVAPSTMGGNVFRTSPACS